MWDRWTQPHHLQQGQHGDLKMTATPEEKEEGEEEEEEDEEEKEEDEEKEEQMDRFCEREINSKSKREMRNDGKRRKGERRV